MYQSNKYPLFSSRKRETGLNPEIFILLCKLVKGFRFVASNLLHHIIPSHLLYSLLTRYFDVSNCSSENFAQLYSNLQLISQCVYALENNIKYLIIIEQFRAKNSVVVIWRVVAGKCNHCYSGNVTR